MSDNNTATKTPPDSLSERVRSLRLTDMSEPSNGGSAWWWLPWAICFVLFCAMSLFALEALSPISDDLLKKLAKERELDIGSGEAGGGGQARSKLNLPGSPKSAETEVALESKGYIVPISLIQVSPKIGGTVLQLNIEEGKEVKKGFLLAVLEDIEYKSEFDRAQGALKFAKAKVEELRKYRDVEILQAKAEWDDAIALRDQMRLRYDRYIDLKTRNAISPEDYENAEATYKSMESRVQRSKLAYDLLREGPRDAKINAALAEVDQASADLRKSQWRLNNTKVEAPIAGIILSKKTEEGNIVNPSAFSNGLSASLCEMADLYKMEVDLSIADRDISKVFKGQACRIHAEAFPNRLYAGHVSRIMPAGDRSKGAVPVRVLINFPAVDEKGNALPMERQGEFLRPEMGAIVTFMNHKAAKLDW